MVAAPAVEADARFTRRSVIASLTVCGSLDDSGDEGDADAAEDGT